MKKSVIVVVLACLCLMLTGCGEKADYNEALSLLEQGDYAGARSIFETIADYEDVPEYLAHYETVEITVENWQEFFDVVQQPTWNTNAFDEGELFGIDYCLVLKPEFALISGDVAMEFSFVERCFVIEINGPEFSYVITDEEAFEMNYHDTSTVRFTAESTPEELYIDHCEVYEDKKGGYWYVYDATGIEIIRTKGQMTVYRK